MSARKKQRERSSRERERCGRVKKGNDRGAGGGAAAAAEKAPGWKLWQPILIKHESRPWSAESCGVPAHGSASCSHMQACLCGSRDTQQRPPTPRQRPTPIHTPGRRHPSHVESNLYPRTCCSSSPSPGIPPSKDQMVSPAPLHRRHDAFKPSV